MPVVQGLGLDRRRSLHDLAPVDFAVILLLVIVSGIGLLWAPFGGSDEALLIIYPERIGAGAVPNRDFFTVYGPGGYRLIQGVFALSGGPSMLAERFVAIAYHGAIVAGLMKLLARYGRAAALAAGLTSTAVMLGFAPLAYAWFGGLALLVWSMALLSSPGRRTSQSYWVAGFLAGMVPLWRPDMGVLLLALTPLVLACRRARWFFGGLGVGLIPLSIHMWIAGSATIENVLLSRLLINAQKSFEVSDWPAWVIIVMSACAPIVVGVEAFRVTAHRDLALSVSMASFMVLPQALQRADIYHAIFIGCFSLPVLAAWVVTRTTLRPKSLLLVVGTPLAATAVTLAIMGWSTTTVEVRNENRAFTAVAGTADRLQAIISALHEEVPFGSRVFFGAQDNSRTGFGDNGLYFLLPEYRNDFYFLELPPGVVTMAASPLMHDISLADALVLNHNDPHAMEIGLPNVPNGDHAVNDFIAHNFCLVAQIDITKIYVRGACSGHGKHSN